MKLHLSLFPIRLDYKAPFLEYYYDNDTGFIATHATRTNGMSYNCIKEFDYILKLFQIKLKQMPLLIRGSLESTGIATHPIVHTYEYTTHIKERRANIHVNTCIRHLML